MADLIAQGADSQHRWRRTLLVGRPVTLGRAPNCWPTSWDDRVSRLHAEISWDGQRLKVRQLDGARNPIFVKGRPEAQFDIEPGEHFVIGETTFTLTDERVNVSLDVPPPAQQQTFSSQYLQKIQFRHTGAHIDVLGRLPEVISGANSDSELSVRLVNLLLTGLPRAGAAALVSVKHPDDERPAIEVLHWDRRLVMGGDFQPSERLILDAVRRRQSVLHVWNAADASTSSAFTVSQGVDWAFCTPVGGKACQGWGIYVAGRFVDDTSTPVEVSDPNDLRDDLKFTELAATTLSALRDVRMLERQRAGLSQFFSPVVLEALQGVDPEMVLAPRETEVSVLFCDLRGFSRHSERSAEDLLGLLNRVSQALGVTTHQIREQGGVLGDFHGDAAMGFWGWPLAQPDAAVRACLAALAIRAEFAETAQRVDDPLADFRVGIGIATGRAVAGKIGTVDQVKVTVFGPVVNLASRLEGMTKILHAPILIDERTAIVVREQLGKNVARLRRVAVVKPYGLDRTLEVTELLPPLASYPALTDQNIADYEKALDDLLAGRWSQAFERAAPRPRRRPREGLSHRLHRPAQPHAAENWNGVIPLTTK